MIPANFDESNCVLSAPPGMEDEVEPLSVMKIDSNGVPMVISCWKLTARELREIQQTGRVWLTVFGQTMPPVTLDGVKPIVHPERN